MKKMNKTTAAVFAGALVTVLGSLVVLDPGIQGAIQTLLIAALVWAVPNVA